MSEDFEILYSDSKESGSQHSHHHSDGEHHSSHHHSDESHHSSHHHGSHRHSKQRKRRKRILIITLSIVACLLIAIGVGGAYGYKIAKREVADVKQQAYTLKADLKNVMAGLKAQDPVATETACDQLDVAIEDINKTFDKKIWKTAYKIPKFKGYIDSVKELLNLVQEASSDIARPTVAVLNDYPLSGLKVDDGFSITTINAYLSLLEDIEPKIDHIVTAMNQVNLPMGLNSMIADYSVQIASMTGSYDNLKEFLPLFKTFIGDGSDRTYLLAAQNSSEIRASGGFPGSIGTIRIRDGVLTIGNFSSVYKVLASYTPSAANITAKEKELLEKEKALCALEEELKKREAELDAQSDKPPSKPKKRPNPLNSEARKLFEEHYQAIFSSSYYWSAKDAGNMSSLLKKLKFQREKKSLPTDDQGVLNALKYLLDSITDGWILENFSVTNINSKFNEIVSQAIAKKNGQTTSNTAFGQHRPDNRRASSGTDAENKRREREHLGNLADAILQQSASENSK